MKAVVTEILACFKTVFERFGLYLDCQTAQSHNVTFFSVGDRDDIHVGSECGFIQKHNFPSKRNQNLLGVYYSNAIKRGYNIIDLRILQKCSYKWYVISFN